jgi:predicted HAD superfamily phosphohydrolase YqeG
MLKLTPGYCTNHFSAVEAKWLRQQNIALVLVYIDNTLVSDNQESAASARE